jgi:UDP-N-acetylglucosamine 2-epimerase (non-hydrolysing)
MKIMLIVGARPNFMKAAPLIAAISERNRNNGAQEPIRPILVHTGQHYGEAMSGSFFADLDLPKPDVHLEVGSASHASQTAEIMRRFEEVLLAEKPEALIVVGDVNSTVACALVAAKISFDSKGTRPLIAHVEAGLRSFDRGMPEEVNRIVTDHLSDLLFVTEESGVQNLIHEGIPAERIHFAGNTMIDSLLAFKGKADASNVLEKLGLRSGLARAKGNSEVARYALLTLHRPSNVDHRETFLSIFEGLQELAGSCPIIFPAHPRTQQRIAEFGLADFFETESDRQNLGGSLPATRSTRIRLVAPLGYLDFMCMMKNAALVITDSGGIQEETTCLGVHCVTVRENTERPVTVNCGTNVIAGTQAEGIRKAIQEQCARQLTNRVPEKWDGMAGTRIVGVIASEIGRKTAEQTDVVAPAASR